MYRCRIIIISGPSGSGKTTLYRKLLVSRRFKGKLVKSISATTRPRRLGERHGRDYLFISKKDFLQKKKNGYFLEWEKVFDNYYGTPDGRVKGLLKKGKNVLLCIDVKGAKTVRRAYPDSVTIFIKTPSWNILKQRLEHRGSEAKKDLSLRLSVAKKELLEAKHYDHIVVNGRLPTALWHLKNIIDRTLNTKERC